MSQKVWVLRTNSFEPKSLTVGDTSFGGSRVTTIPLYIVMAISGFTIKIGFNVSLGERNTDI